MRGKGVRLSGIMHGRVATTPLERTTATIFPFPSNSGKDCDITVAVFGRLPPSDGSVRSFEGHVLAVHLGRPLPIRQRREDLCHEWTFTRGDLTLIPAGWQTTCWTQKTADFLHIELGRGLVHSAAAGSTPDVEMPCIFSFDDPVSRELSLSMLAEAQTQGTAARMYVESAAMVLAQRLMNRRSVTPTSKSGLPPAVLQRAKEFLHDGLDRNPGVAELSAAVGMNVHHFSRLFKRSTGLAPYQYLSNIRLEHAKKLLTEGRSQIIEIAFETGYSNPSQFSAFFRKRTGLSPSDFRRRLQPARNQTR
jgi:AraC family transcriptional regulator